MKEREFVLDEDTLKRNRRVEFVGKSRTDPSMELRVSFPDSFPSKPPHVHTAPTVKLSRHHRPDTSEICTFGPTRGRWRANLSGTTAIDEAEGVIAAASGSHSGNQEYLDDVPEPASALYHYLPNTFILVPPAIAAFAAQMSEGSSAPFRGRFESWPGQPTARYGPGRGIVTEIGQKPAVKAENWHEKILPRRESLEITGSIVRLATPPRIPAGIQEFNLWLQGLEQKRTDWMAFVFPEQTGDATTRRLAWLFVRSQRSVQNIKTFLMDGGGRAARVPGLSPLADKRIVFLGCGSLGSKIATSLAATGVNHFGLIDFDFMEPDNAVRHESGVNHFGLAKVEALTSRLFELNPQITCGTKFLPMVIGGTNDIAKEEELHGLLAAASLVIDTTGDHGVSRFLNDICGELNVPQVYASVSNGAWGGEVVRVIPGRSACWVCWLEQFEAIRPSAEPAPDVGVFAPGCDQPTFTGTSYELNIVAGLAASFAVDTLLIGDAARKHYEGDYIRWQMRDPEGQFLPKIEVLSTHKRNPCPFCNPN